MTSTSAKAAETRSRRDAARGLLPDISAILMHYFEQPELRKIEYKMARLERDKASAQWHNDYEGECRACLGAGTTQGARCSECYGTGHRRWCWHASALAGCPRAAVLRRAKLATDPRTRDSYLVTGLGTMWHEQLEDAFRMWIDDGVDKSFRLIVSEVGNAHRTMNLAAKPDIVYAKAFRGAAGETVWVPVILDVKTERASGIGHRQEEARRVGIPADAKHGHLVQCTATAEVLEDHNYIPAGEYQTNVPGRFDWSVLLYVNREDFTWDPQVFEITPELRTEVRERVELLDAHWDDWLAAEFLPSRMPSDSFLCRPASVVTGVGKFCQARSACFTPGVGANECIEPTLERR